MRGINNRITHSLRALLTRHGRTTCRVSLHCRLNVFCLFCAAKVRIIREETKKSPKTLLFVKSSGKGFIGLRKIIQREALQELQDQVEDLHRSNLPMWACQMSLQLHHLLSSKYSVHVSLSPML